MFGACVGSYLNVVIYRLPLGLSTNDPKRSFCPICKKEIPMSRNIPLITWLVQKGKCAECSAPIPVRYFLVELFTALIWVACWWFFAVHTPAPFGAPWYYPPAIAAFFILISTLAISITCIDIDHMIIPAPLTYMGMVAGLAAGALLPHHLGAETMIEGLMASGWGLIAGFGALWLVVLIGKLLFGKKSFDFDKPTEWHLRDANPDDPNDDISFVLDGEDNFWWELFFRKSDKLILNGVADVELDGEKIDTDSMVIQRERVIAGDKEVEIEKLKSLKGTVQSVVIPREAMGMGDVHLLGMIGACLGWQSLLFVILAASLFGIVVHLAARAGLGKPMPFGPSLLAGAVAWVLVGEQTVDWYIKFVNQLAGAPTV